ncbi:MAG: PilZ domain-containing protein [Terracidiphilus sp.]|jgi:hypothetical protein
MDGTQHGECFAAPGQEGRAQPRYSVDEDTVLLLVSHGMPLSAHIVDLSLEGCRVRIYQQFTGRAGWPVELSFKANGVAFRIRGIVRWSDGQHLLGIKFAAMIPRRRAELAEVIEEMAETLAERAKAVDQLIREQGVPAPDLPEIPEMVEAKTAALEVVKAIAPQNAARSIEPPAETEEAEISAEIEPPVRQPATLRDRRGQTRHEVHHFATIILVKTGSALPGRILDLSLSGCRIGTDERFPAGIYARVETEFYLQGLAFRLEGVIQAVHDRDTVGIRFLDLTNRKRQQLVELIGEVEQEGAAMPQGGASSAEDRLQADGR